MENQPNEYQKTGLAELKRLREIVEWQIRIAVDVDIVQKRQRQLIQINEQIRKLEQ